MVSKGYEGFQGISGGSVYDSAEVYMNQLRKTLKTHRILAWEVADTLIYSSP